MKILEAWKKTKKNQGRGKSKSKNKNNEEIGLLKGRSQTRRMNVLKVKEKSEHKLTNIINRYKGKTSPWDTFLPK